MPRKEIPSLDSFHTPGSGLDCSAQSSSEAKTGVSERPWSPTDLSTFSSSDKCTYDSRYSDSGVWSGSNIQSGELTTPESPVPKSVDFSYSSDNLSGDKNFMRLDSGIDVSVSQQFSELSVKDSCTCNDLNNPPTKAKESTTPVANINKEQGINKPYSKDQPSLQKLVLLENYFKQNEDGDTDLHLAIIHRFIETVYALIRMVPHPKYLNIKNDERQTPLHLAVLTRQPRLVRLLVCAGAAFDVVDRFGNTPLHLAVQAEDLLCIRALIDPITTDETHVVQLQYSPFQFHSQKNVANIYNYEGQTCVHMAAWIGNIEILRYLLWYGANINAKEWKGGHTCLHMAVERKDMPLCMFLLAETNIDADEMSYAGYTAYQTAACCNFDSAIAEALRNHGVDTYVQSDTESEDDDDMFDMMERSGFKNGFQVNGGGLVNVGA